MKKIFILIAMALGFTSANACDKCAYPSFYVGVQEHYVQRDVKNKKYSGDLKHKSNAEHFLLGIRPTEGFGIEGGLTYLRGKTRNGHIDFVGFLPLDSTHTIFASLGAGRHSQHKKIADRHNKVRGRIGFGYQAKLNDSVSFRVSAHHQHGHNSIRQLISAGGGFVFHF